VRTLLDDFQEICGGISLRKLCSLEKAKSLLVGDAVFVLLTIKDVNPGTSATSA
jgi:hypothetical protein